MLDVLKNMNYSSEEAFANAANKCLLFYLIESHRSVLRKHKMVCRGGGLDKCVLGVE